MFTREIYNKHILSIYDYAEKAIKHIGFSLDSFSTLKVLFTSERSVKKVVN